MGQLINLVHYSTPSLLIYQKMNTWMTMKETARQI